MPFDRQRSGRSYNGRPRTNRGRERFPYWTLPVIALCAGLWFCGVKLYEEKMAAYDLYAAISQAVLKPTFYAGITVDGVDLSGKTMEEALAIFEERKQQDTQAFSLVVASGDKRWRITSDEVAMTFDAKTVLKQAYQIGRYGTLEERYAQIARLASEGMAFETGFTYDRTAIKKLADIIADSLDVPAKDAMLDAFDVTNRTFTFAKEEAGYRVDRERLAADILSALDAKAYDRQISPHGEKVQPSRVISDLKGNFGKISSFTTQTTKDYDRNTNIAISASALNGRMVKPGETLSFNQCTGQRTGEKGYREAHAIANGVLVDDTGGGVCQTSSTLFNAVIRADMEIVKRSAHSWPSTYVNKGEDATVNWPSLDFVFRNNSEYPVFIVAWYADQQVTVEVYGKMLSDGQAIDLESTVTKTLKPSDETLYTLDETLPVGSRQAGRKKRTGYVVDTFKIYKDAAGNEIRREKLWTTTYRAMQNEILYH